MTDRLPLAIDGQGSQSQSIIDNPYYDWIVCWRNFGQRNYYRRTDMRDSRPNARCFSDNDDVERFNAKESTIKTQDRFVRRAKLVASNPAVAP